MNRLAQIENEISQLTPPELAALRNWFAEYDARAWDQQIEADVALGKLDRLADEALREHAAGQTTEL